MQQNCFLCRKTVVTYYYTDFFYNGLEYIYKYIYYFSNKYNNKCQKCTIETVFLYVFYFIIKHAYLLKNVMFLC